MTCTRVSDESLIDLLFGDGPDADRAHVAGCPGCAGRLRELEASLARARSAELPEPSPFYWAALRRNVRRRVGQVRSWRWAPFAAAAAALLVAIGVVSGERPASRSPGPALPAWVALPPAGEDAGLDVIGGLLSSGSEEDLGACTGLAPCLASLSDAETRALVDALRADLEGVDS
jgi:hypothetical protein